MPGPGLIVTVTRQLPGGGAAVAISRQKYVGGNLVEEENLETGETLTHMYNVFGERLSTKDIHAGWMRVWTYDNGGRVTDTFLVSNGTPLTERVGYLYASSGLLQHTIVNGSGTTTDQYYPDGRLEKRHGAGSHPVKWNYNTYGDLYQMRTWRSSAADAQADVTQWNYDAGSGLLLSKQDAASKLTQYTYLPAGLLETRTWARGVTTTYAYDAAGRLTGVNYSDATPDVSYTLDRAGRVLSIADGTGTREFDHSGPGGALAEIEYSGQGSPLAGVSLAYGHDARARRTSLTLSRSGAVLSSTTHAFTAGSTQLLSVTHGGVTATYDRATRPVAGLPAGLSYSGAGVRSRRVADALGRLDKVETYPAPASAGVPAVVATDYTLDAAGRRTAAQREDGQGWTWGYNLRGEVTSASRAGAAYAYAYDEIGNRATARTRGIGTPDQGTEYTTNTLNQYTSIKHPDPTKFLVQGRAHPEAAVTVRSTDHQPDGTAVADTSGATRPAAGASAYSATGSAAVTAAGAWRRVEVTASRPGAGLNAGTASTSREGWLWLPPRDEALAHDLDGNLTQSARWQLEWDGENRLAVMEEKAIPRPPGAPARVRLELAYDSQGRRARKVVKTWNPSGGAFQIATDRRFVYDDWNMIAELETPTGASGPLALVASYAWGLDLSGTEQGAGGVGGLVLAALHSASATPAPGSVLLAPGYDGNGNILAWLDCASGQAVARQEYDPFGNVILQEQAPSVAGRLSFGFSTKYTDAETGWCYYGYRYYSPEMGRWLSRDPIGEEGGVNLSALKINDAVNKYDYLGLDGGSGLQNLSGVGGGIWGATGPPPRGEPYPRQEEWVADTWGAWRIVVEEHGDEDVRAFMGIDLSFHPYQRLRPHCTEFIIFRDARSIIWGNWFNDYGPANVAQANSLSGGWRGRIGPRPANAPFDSPSWIVPAKFKFQWRVKCICSKEKSWDQAVFAAITREFSVDQNGTRLLP